MAEAMDAALGRCEEEMAPEAGGGEGMAQEAADAGGGGGEKGDGARVAPPAPPRWNLRALHSLAPRARVRACAYALRAAPLAGALDCAEGARLPGLLARAVLWYAALPSLRAAPQRHREQS